MGKNREIANTFVKKYCILYGVSEILLQEPYFDLPEIIDEKVELECSIHSTEYFDQIELYCNQHLVIEKDKVLFQDLSSYTAFWYQIMENGKLLKTKLQILQEQKSLSYQKEESLYSNFGLEVKKKIRNYKQSISNDEQIQKVLSCFPMDPDLWNMPFINEVILNRSLDMDTVNILITSFNNYPYQLELPLALESAQDLFVLRFSNDKVLETIISSISNCQTVILPEIGDASERKNHLFHLIEQITDVTLKQKMFDYYSQEPVCNTDCKLELTCVRFL